MIVRHPLAAVRLTALLLLTGGLLPLYLAAMPFGRRACRPISWLYFRGCLVLAGVRLQRCGLAFEGRGALHLANHVSYLDIPALAALTDGVFVAKSEVRAWPVFGFLARIFGSVFVSRTPTTLSRERLEVAGHLTRGSAVFLFPEASSSDGLGVLPFRPGLISAAQWSETTDVPVQPVSIVYGAPQGTLPALSPTERDRYAWYGDMPLLPHLWRLLGHDRRMVIAVHFHPSRQSSEFASPRELARWAERAVADGLSQALAGKRTAAEAAPTPALEMALSHAAPPSQRNAR